MAEGPAGIQPEEAKLHFVGCEHTFCMSVVASGLSVGGSGVY